MDYYSDTRRARPIMEKLAAFEPETLACMHGSAWRGDGGKLLLELASAFGAWCSQWGAGALTGGDASV